MIYLPGEILLQWFIDQAMLSDPLRELSWPGYFSTLPTDPDNIVVIYDTRGRMQGRLMRGPTQVKPGFQIRCRALQPRDAANKLATLKDALDAVKIAKVEMDSGDVYWIHSVMQTSNILPLGEEDEKQRFSYVINGILSISGALA